MAASRSGDWLSAVYQSGVGGDSILYIVCDDWVHKSCSGININLSNVTDFTYKVCSDSQTIKPRVESIDILNVDTLCFLHIIGAGGRAEACSIGRDRSEWKKFKELISFLTMRGLSLVVAVQSRLTKIHFGLVDHLWLDW